MATGNATLFFLWSAAKTPAPRDRLGLRGAIYVKTSRRSLVSFSGAVALFNKGTGEAA